MERARPIRLPGTPQQPCLRRRAAIAGALGIAAMPSLRAGEVAMALANAAAPATPLVDRVLKIVAFAGGWNLPLWVAEEQGLFAREGVAVELAYTPNSGALVRGLMESRHDLALAAIDNLIAYQEGQGDGPLLASPDLVAVMGVDYGFLSVVAQPGIRTMTDLRGKTLSVDSLNTGFAYVLRELLRLHGISGAEVTIVRGGATELRFQALVDGKVDATLLRTPFDILAAERGLSVLASADTLGPYVGTSGFVRRSWAQANEATLVAFLRGYRRAMQWLDGPAHRGSAEATLVARIDGMTPAVAKRAAATLLDQESGLVRDLAIDDAGVRTVLALRQRYGAPPRTLGDVDRYVDLRYRAKALGT